MGAEYSPDKVFEAEDLYCLDRLTFREVGKRTGIPLSTLKRWAGKYGWQAKRAELREAMSAIRADKIRLRAKLISNCLNTLDPMDAFAVAKIEELVLKAQALAIKGEDLRTGTAGREIHTQEDAAAALEEALTVKLNRMLVTGDLDLNAVKNVKQAFDLIAGMKTKDGKATGRDKGLSKETAEQIREQILGR